MRKNSKFLESYYQLRPKPVGYIGGGVASPYVQQGQTPMQGMPQSPFANAGLYQGAAQLGNMAIDNIDPADEFGATSDAAAIGKGALTGAATGAAIGSVVPGIGTAIGAVGGAIVGGVSSGVGNLKKKKKASAAYNKRITDQNMEARRYNIQDMASFKQGGRRMTQLYPRFMVPAGNSNIQTVKFFLHGGNLMEEFGPESINPDWVDEYFEVPGEFDPPRGWARGGRKVPGGQVKALSGRAVEFEGNNPNATDGINLGGSTYVDDNEAMVDTPAGQIIASDSVFLGGGKRSVANQIKSLQRRRARTRSPKRRGFYDYRTDVKLAQQELETGRVDPKQVLKLAEPGGEELRHGGIGDKDPNFHPGLADDIEFAYGGLYSGNSPVDETEFFNLQNMPDRRKKQKERGIALKDGGLRINDDILGRVKDYMCGGKKSGYAAGGKPEDDESDDTYIERLAENESDEELEDQLEMGIEPEAEEHHVSLKKGKTIAAQHLKEDKKYYTKLKKAGLAHGGKEPKMFSLPVYHDVSGYEQELETEPGHGPGSGTFRMGGHRYFDDRAKFKKGGKSGIYIKPSKRGSFTAWAKRHNMGVQEAAGHVMANKGKYSSAIVKKANFARNASKWKHQEGGQPRYVPEGYDYLSGDASTHTPLGTISREQYEAYQADPLGNASLRSPYTDMGWQNVQKRFTNPDVMSIKSGNINQPWGMFDQIMGTEVDPLANLPQMETPGLNMPAVTTTPPATLDPFKAPAGPRTSRKVNAFKYNIPRNKQFRKGLQRMTGFQTGGIDRRNSWEQLPDYDPVLISPPSEDWVPEMPDTLPTREVGPGGGTSADVRRQKWQNTLNDLGRGAATFGPDIANMINYATMPDVPRPRMAPMTKLRPVSNRSQMAQISEAGRSANKALLNQGTQLGTTMAGVNANLATKLGAINQANESLRNMNTSIQNREAILNNRTSLMNTGLMNKYLSDQLGRKLSQRRGIAGSLASMGTKGQAMYAEKSQKELDKQRLAIIEKMFPSGIYDRNMADLMNLYMQQRGITR